MHILDLFVAHYPADGGCDEGPGYWSVAAGALFSNLELLRSASGGRIVVYDAPVVQEMARFIYRAHIGGDYFINFADASPKELPQAGLVYRFGQRIGDEHLMTFGRFLHQKLKRSWTGNTELLLALPELFEPAKGISAPGAAPLPRDVWLPGLQVMTAREREGADAGFYLAAKGGHNAESHNHNDVGQFLLYLDTKPVLIDPGIGTYTRQTFSADRWKLWTVQSAYHNLPTVNGVIQKEGAEFRATDVAYQADAKAAEFSLNIAGAYPRASGIQSWRRTCRLVRDSEGSVEIVDDFALEKPSQDVALSLMTPLRPEVSAPGVVVLGDASLLFKADTVTAAVEPIELEDGHLRQSWGDKLYRVVLRSTSPVEKGAWIVRLVRRLREAEKR
jgi:hypothetical protein